MGNLLSKPRRQLNCKNWRELDTLRRQYRFTYGHLSNDQEQILFAEAQGIHPGRIRQIEAQRAAYYGTTT